MTSVAKYDYHTFLYYNLQNNELLDRSMDLKTAQYLCMRRNLTETVKNQLDLFQGYRNL